MKKIRRACLLSFRQESSNTSLACLQWRQADSVQINPGEVAQCLLSNQESAFVAYASLVSADNRFDWLVRHNTPLHRYLESRVQHMDVDIRAPYGLAFPMDRMVGRSITLVAAGTGIAPMRAVIQSILTNRKRYRSVNLLYGVRTAEEFAFCSETEAWNAVGVRTVRTISQPNDREWVEEVGYVQRHLSGVVRPGAEGFVLVCGGHQMTMETIDLAEALGVLPENVLSNYSA